MVFFFFVSFVGFFVVFFGVYVFIYNIVIKLRKCVCCEYVSVILCCEICVIGIVVFVIGVFLIVWFLFFVVIVVVIYELECFFEFLGFFWLIVFVKVLYYINLGLNLIIYGYCSFEMGKIMWNIVLKCFFVGKFLKILFDGCL